VGIEMNDTLKGEEEGGRITEEKGQNKACSTSNCIPPLGAELDLNGRKDETSRQSEKNYWKKGAYVYSQGG